MSSNNTTLVLVSVEGERVEISAKAAEFSKLITTTITDAGSAEEEIPLESVTAPILRKIVEWMEHHTQHPVWKIQHPLKASDLRNCGASEFDANFFDSVDYDTAGEIICAANYLDIYDLVQLGAAKVQYDCKF